MNADQGPHDADVQNADLDESLWPPPDPEIWAALEAAFHSGDWGRYHGAQSIALADELSAYHHGVACLLCSSGTIAVELALRGLGVQAGDEVILAGYDFPGNFRAIEAIGARPVLIDLAENRWTIAADAIPDAVSDMTKSIVISHLHGDLACVPELADVARRFGLSVLEDACQVPGARLNGQRAGTIGDVGVLSFGGSKLLTAGRGGAILSRSPEVIQRAKIFSERGNEAFPLSELQAAVIRPQLRKLDSRNEIRRQNVNRLLDELQGISVLRPVEISRSGNSPSFYKLAFRLCSSDTTRDEFLRGAELQALPLGAGFRGFYRRSARRCRTVGPLDHCRIAAAQTVLLHHPVLLGTSESMLDTANRFRRALALPA